MKAGELLVAACFVLAPEAALACAVCSPGQNDAAQAGFLIGTVLLSVLPLVLIGSVVLVLVRRARRMARDEALGLAPASPPLPIGSSPARPAAR